MKRTLLLSVIAILTGINSGFGSSHIQWQQQLNGLTNENVIDSFPHRLYLNSVNLGDIAAVSNHLALLDSLKLNGGYVLSTAFTEKLKKEPAFQNYFLGLDSVGKLICIAEKYKSAGEIDSKHKIFYESVWDDWMNSSANYLADTASKNSDLKLNHQFMYLTQRLAENNHKYAAPPLSDMDKMLYQISEQNWSYLLDRFRTRTPWWFKAGLLLFFALFIAGQISLIKNFKLNRT